MLEDYLCEEKKRETKDQAIEVRVEGRRTALHIRLFPMAYFAWATQPQKSCKDEKTLNRS